MAHMRDAWPEKTQKSRGGVTALSHDDVVWSLGHTLHCHTRTNSPPSRQLRPQSAASTVNFQRCNAQASRNMASSQYCSSGTSRWYYAFRAGGGASMVLARCRRAEHNAPCTANSTGGGTRAKTKLSSYFDFDLVCRCRTSEHSSPN